MTPADIERILGVLARRNSIHELVEACGALLEQVQRLTVERDQLDQLRARVEELEAKQHDCVIAEKLSDDAYDLAGWLEVQLANATEALEAVLEISSDRQAFVTQGARAFFRAEQIARNALAKLRSGQ